MRRRELAQVPGVDQLGPQPHHVLGRQFAGRSQLVQPDQAGAPRRSAGIRVREQNDPGAG
jgi:hypothetical protein